MGEFVLPPDGETAIERAVLRRGDDCLIYGASPDRFEEMEETLLAVLASEGFERQAYEQEAFSESYRRAWERPARTAHWNLVRGTMVWDGVTCIDWWTHVDQPTRRSVEEAFIEAFKDSESIELVETRADVPALLERAFPQVGRSGLYRLISRPIWSHIREDRDKLLSDGSREAITNGTNGYIFEKHFERFCEQNDIRYWKAAADRFFETFPAKYAETTSKRGYPDYFIDTGNSSSLTNWTDDEGRSWDIPTRYAFVEVKYNTSSLQSVQRRRIEEIKATGIPCYLYTGTMSQQEIEEL